MMLEQRKLMLFQKVAPEPPTLAPHRARGPGAGRPYVHDLHQAILQGDTAGVTELLGRDSLDVNATVCGATALSLTLYRGRPALLRTLLTAPRLDVNKLSKDDKQRLEPALVTAARLADREAVRLLVEAGADLEGKDNFQHTALWMATSERHTDIVRYLIACGADVNPSRVWTHSPLFFAVRCSSKRVEIAKMLLYHGAEVSVIRGSSLLYCAIIQGDLHIARLIVDAGYNVPQDHKLRTEFGSGVLSRNSTLLSWLAEELHIPASLQRQCRAIIRRLVSASATTSFLDKLQRLPLPTSIVHYLALTHDLSLIRCTKTLAGSSK